MVVPGFFRGNCANCYYSSEDTRYSLYSVTTAAPIPTSPVPTTGRCLRPATISSSRPLSGIVPRDRIVDQIASSTISNYKFYSRTIIVR
ncbi:hypothetical protein NA56DRAFT_648982, partial [Hyaloscypha hepaticicola]